jgi:DNA-binding NtrC family response regulator
MTRRKPLVLIVDDDANYRRVVEAALLTDFDVVSAADVESANQKLTLDLSLVLLDLRLNDAVDADRESLKLLEALHQSRHVPIVIMTAYGDIDTAVEAMKRGASDFIQKARTDARELRKVIANAIEKSRLERRVAELEEEMHRLQPWDLIGSHARIQEVRQLIEMVAADGYTSVLVRGETGTGKEIVARAVHDRGWRKDAPFVAVALPALTPTLVESELFGHVRGAFTDAHETRQGYIQKAAGGVLFLDEIGDLTADLQPKLLRFLDGRAFSPIGSPSPTQVDLQVVCATNRNLEEAVRAGDFREDLYYRLRTVEIIIPPLRERLEDVPLLVDHFLFQFRQQARTRVAGVASDALHQLSRYAFPGNVRELKGIVERAMMMAALHSHALIELDDLPHDVAASITPRVQMTDGDNFDLDGELARAELGHIERALRKTEGRKSEAWRLLGLNDRFALLRRVKRIRDQYPHLVSEFPLIQSRYADNDPA